MPRHNINVYVACSLTHASPEFRDQVATLKQMLGSLCNVLCFLGCGTGASPREVYEWDIGCVEKSDLVLAICDQPSTGMGWEMATQAEKRRMPVLAVAHTTSLVSEMILDPGLAGYEFRRYSNLLQDVFTMMEEKLERMSQEANRQPSLFSEDRLAQVA